MSKGWHHRPVVTNLFGPMSPFLALKLFATPTLTFVHLLPYKCFFLSDQHLHVILTSACDLNFRLNSSSTRACVEIRELSRIFPFRRWLPVIPPLYFSPVILPVLSLLPHWVQMGRLNQDVQIYFATQNYLKVRCLNVKKNIRGDNVFHDHISHLNDDSRRRINV